MSHGTSTKSNITSSTKTIATNGATLSILRSNGVKDEITCSLETTTLRDFKMLVSQSNKLGMVPINQQRIFHYGRELKTLGRTLQALGVGRFNNSSGNKAGPKIVIHLHTIPYSNAISNGMNDMKQAFATTATTNSQRQTTIARPRTTRTATRATASAPISSIVSSTTSTSSSMSTTNQLPAPEVVDLYSDDENDDIVVVVNKPNTSTSTAATTTSTSNHSNKRRRT